MRMIERWFPCDEVSSQSAQGWGSGASEKSLFTWFAARPLAQARAAVLTSLLPWPDSPDEQKRLQKLVLDALSGRDVATAKVRAELAKCYPDGAAALDLFSGRAIIPLEIARAGVKSFGIDYSPVATLAGQLLAHYPARDWSGEPPLPFGGEAHYERKMRLASDVAAVLGEIGERWRASMEEFYPRDAKGNFPWGYLWAVTLPCQNCGRRFPLVGRLELLHPNPKRKLSGQSYRILPDHASGKWEIAVHEGAPMGAPTRVVAQGKSKYDSSGRLAVCPFCEHPHEGDVQRRLMGQNRGEDALLVASDIATLGKVFREPSDEEREAPRRASEALKRESPFPNGLPAVPDERIPPQNTRFIQPLIYGAKTWGDLCTDRQTLGFVRLCRIINDVSVELKQAGFSEDYVAALSGYAASTVVLKLKRSTRGATLDASRSGVGHIFGSRESAIGYSYDFFESGLNSAAGGWESLSENTVRAVEVQCESESDTAATLVRGSATHLPFADATLSAIICDPPYDDMINYSDASDLFFVWLKRTLASSHPHFSLTLDANGNQEKTEEITVARSSGTIIIDHRTQEHYNELFAVSLKEAQRVTKSDGVVTIVFGHGDPDVWERLLNTICNAQLVLTGSWPAKTESGGQAGSANIRTTLTLACRPAPAERPIGKVAQVEAELASVIAERVQLWEASHLALTDQLMASAGPAMEVVGRYRVIKNVMGDEVAPRRFLTLARRLVQENAAIRIEELPLETFPDARTRFALFWVKIYGRALADKSEARWHALASDLKLDRVLAAKRGILVEPAKGRDKGVRFISSHEFEPSISEQSDTIDVALAMASAWNEGLDAVSDVLTRAGRDQNDTFLWATLKFLCRFLPDGDPDRAAWTSLVRAQNSISATVSRKIAAREGATQLQLPM